MKPSFCRFHDSMILSGLHNLAQLISELLSLVVESHSLFLLARGFQFVADVSCLHLLTTVTATTLYLALFYLVTLRWESLKAGWPYWSHLWVLLSLGQLLGQPSCQHHSSLAQYHCCWSTQVITDMITALRSVTHFAHVKLLQSQHLLRPHWRCFEPWS